MVSAEWVLLLMLKGQPAPVPWRSTYEGTAEAIARASDASPLFEGEHGPAKTAAVLVATAIAESALKPDAVGDNGTSFCLLQVNQSNFASLGVTRARVQEDVGTCVSAALRLMHGSFRVCRGRPLLERLGHYASGGPTCGGLAASRSRMGRALQLFERHPPPSDWEAAALAIGR